MRFFYKKDISSKKLIKDQVPDMSWGHLSVSLALIRRKYGICRDDLEVSFRKVQDSKVRFQIPNLISTNYFLRSNAMYLLA